MTQEVKIILTEQEIINTYNEYQQAQAKLYNEYKQIRQQNPTFGYKRIATLLNQPYAKTRWWHTQGRIPPPIQTVNWLKERGLLPLATNHQKLPLIARILGTTFGDGGIFENLNGIFLSSSETDVIDEFKADLKAISGVSIDENARIIKAGEYGESWCYQNTNRNIIRFFIALGAPTGKKSLKELQLPRWIKLMDETEDNFFGAFFGNEINIPKMHIEGNHLDTLSIGITGLPKLERNRREFLTQIADYLNRRNVMTGSVCVGKNKKRENSFVYRLLISTTLENVMNLKKLVPIYYSTLKKDKLAKTIEKFIEVKKQRLNDLMLMGYTAEAAITLLKIKNIDLINKTVLENTTNNTGQQ